MLQAFDDGRLFGTTFGRGPAAVVALPGWMRTAADFAPVLDGLGDGAIAVDLPGFGGATPEPPCAWGSADYARAVAPVLAQLGRPAVVVGHSRGGVVAVHLAASRPELVRALVVTAAPLLPRTDRPAARPKPLYRMARALHRRRLLSEDRMERLRRRSGSADYRNATGRMREVFVRVVNEWCDAELPKVACPVELVWAADDGEVPVSVAERAAALLPAARLTISPTGGHLTPLTIPGVLREAIARHLP